MECVCKIAIHWGLFGNGSEGDMIAGATKTLHDRHKKEAARLKRIQTLQRLWEEAGWEEPWKREQAAARRRSAEAMSCDPTRPSGPRGTG